MRKVIIGGFIGAIIAFAWSFVSWGVLPWHESSIHSFKNEDFVSWVIKEHVPESGVYMAPSLKSTGTHMTPAEIKQSAKEQKAAMKKGPIIFAQVRLHGANPYGFQMMLASFFTQFVGAFLICILLGKVKGTGYGGRLFFVTLVGLIVGILGYVPGWTWWGAGWKYTAVMVADLTATWFLVGLFLAGFIKERKVRVEASAPHGPAD